jgi:hypothetical protein
VLIHIICCEASVNKKTRWAPVCGARAHPFAERQLEHNTVVVFAPCSRRAVEISGAVESHAGPSKFRFLDSIDNENPLVKPRVRNPYKTYVLGRAVFS